MAYKKFTASEDILKPDPRFNSKLVSKFINCLMWDGKKTVAQKVFYGAMDQVAKKMFADRVPAERMEQFVADFSAYRFDEVLGDWQPYETVLKNSIRRLCRKWKLQYLDAEAQQYYDAVPTWGPHEDVPAGLAKVAREIRR